MLKFFCWLLALIVLSACSFATDQRQKIIIGLDVAAAPRILQPQQPDPHNTGIAALDRLNQKWGVQQMVALFPDVSPTDAAAVRNGLTGIYTLVVPRWTNIDEMIAEYAADPQIAYAERSAPVETK
jgi:hypothetical protein